MDRSRQGVRIGSGSTIGQMARPPLGPLERRVLEHLWRVGPASVGEALEAVRETSGRPLAYTTVLTILVRLHDKGYVSRTREGRGFRYAAAFPENALASEVGRRDLQRLIDRHGAKTLAGFAADLVGADADLTARLHKLAAERSDE